MPIRMFHIGFEYVNPGFPKTDIISQHFSDLEDKIVFNIRESNVLLIGNFVQPKDIPFIMEFKGLKILYVGEPIGKFEFSHIFDQIFAKRIYDYAIGCISNNPSMNWIKCPFYYNMATNLKEVNAYVSTTQL